MAKVVIVGAGGYVFPLTLIRDLLAFPALAETRLSLFDIDPARVAVTAGGARELIDAHGLGATIEIPTERRAALEGADVVICTFQVGGLDAYRSDVEIPRRYGIDQTVGDTLGPGGVFRGLRSIGALRGLAADMREVCPNALLIQYANPMSINCWATEALGVSTVGLCHSVQHTSAMLAREIGIPYEEITFDSAGVNHTAWFTTFRRGDEDLLPVIRQVMSDRHLGGESGGERRPDEVYAGGSERVRTELMRLTGYFHTESSHHASEYWAWFRKGPEVVAEYLPTRWDYFDICSNHSPEQRVTEYVERSRREGLHPSNEYGAYIVDSLVTGEQRVIYGNVPNRGLVTNLAADACVEVACLVDDHGVRPIVYGELPPVCAALNTVQINVQRLAVRAGLEGDRDLVYAAVALDPLTGALLTLPEIRRMVDELFEAEASWLPQFEGSPVPAMA